MIRFYKKHIFNLVDRLRNLDPSSDNFDVLIETQLYILKRILQTEERIDKRKRELGDLKASLRRDRLCKNDAKKTKDRIEHLKKRITKYKWLLYIWRCFGDGIAFIYLDKWGLKSLMYEHNSPDVKQQAGFIGGKEGIYNEFALVLEAKKHGVPALLTDLTNIIRHGDVCLLGASDPHVIEVKSSPNKNKRVDRQLEGIEKIHSYLENDAGDSVRGVPRMHRVEIQCKEIHHNKAINEAIKTALDVGFCKSTPEAGLHYFVYKTEVEMDYDEMFKGIEKPILHLINQAKTEKTWGNYYPFTLSIKSGESLYAFLKGDIYIVVVFDGAIMEAMAKDMGYSFDVVMTEDVAYSFSKEIEGWEEPFTSFVSEHFAGRLAFEFLSLKWFMEMEKHNLEIIEEDLNNQIKSLSG